MAAKSEQSRCGDGHRQEAGLGVWCWWRAYDGGATRKEDAGRGAESSDALRRWALLRGEVPE
jgi:hypothetical protein